MRLTNPTRAGSALHGALHGTLRGAVRVSILAASALAVAAVVAAALFLPDVLTSDAPIVLVTLDTTRADHLTVYGYDRPTSPVLARLAATGVVFEEAIATAPNTAVSHASILTGLDPPRHGLRRMHGGSAADLAPDARFLAEVLAGEGYRTAAFVSAFPAGSHFGLDRGFEVFDEEFTGEGDTVGAGGVINTGAAQRAAGATIERALAWLQGLDPGEPYLLWVHLFDPHDPLIHPERVDALGFEFAAAEAAGRESPAARERFLIDLYDAEIAVADAAIGRLLDAVEARGDAPIVAVVGDHGEGLGDHDWWTHGNLYHEQIRVPMFLAGPGVARRRVEGTVRTTDLAPTLLDLVGHAGPEAARLDGLSLARVVGSADEALGLLPAAYAEVRGSMTYNLRWVGHRRPEVRGESFMVVEDGWKLIHRLEDDRLELYDLAADPREERDRSGEPGHGERIATLVGRLRDRGAYSEDGQGGSIPPGVAEKLRSLGYGG